MRTKHPVRLPPWTLVFALLAARAAFAGDYLDQGRTIVDPQTTTERFTFTLKEGTPPPLFDLTIQMSQGRAELGILDSSGRRVHQIGAQACTASAPPLKASDPGTYAAEITTVQAVGSWRLRIYDAPPKPATSSVPGLTAAGLMMVVASPASGSGASGRAFPGVGSGWAPLSGPWPSWPSSPSPSP